MIRSDKIKLKGHEMNHLQMQSRFHVLSLLSLWQCLLFFCCLCVTIDSEFARKLNIQSELGAKLNSIVNMILDLLRE